MKLFKGKYSKMIMLSTMTGLCLNIIAGFISMQLTGALWLFLAIPRSILSWPIAATVSLPLMKKHKIYAICTYLVAVLIFVGLGLHLDNLNDASTKGLIIVFYLLFAIFSFPFIFIVPSLINGRLKEKLQMNYPPPLPKEDGKNKK